MTPDEKIQYLLSTIRKARYEVLNGDLRGVWNALYVPAEIEQTSRHPKEAFRDAR